MMRTIMKMLTMTLELFVMKKIAVFLERLFKNLCSRKEILLNAPFISTVVLVIIIIIACLLKKTFCLHIYRSILLPRQSVHTFM